MHKLNKAKENLDLVGLTTLNAHDLSDSDWHEISHSLSNPRPRAMAFRYVRGLDCIGSMASGLLIGILQ
jgi:hypothetical protein